MAKNVHEWRIKNPELASKIGRKKKLKERYGISIEEYELHVKLQNGKCLGCNENKRLDVDHDHLTGKFRGLLCNDCNNALGRSKDRPEVLRRLADYLENRLLRRVA